MNPEQARLWAHRHREANWRLWGPYLSERAWGTVREDYSPQGDAWTYLPHDHARSRAYRWNEDGLAGISDRHQFLCFALALWNGQDPILKERLFGLTGPEGNHGEDVKEYYFYLDNTPTHSYMKMLYRYPHAAFPYAELVDVNRRRGPGEWEYELLDTGVFQEDRYFDVTVEYAKADAADILIRITAHNRGPEPADLYLLPTLWFRNLWSWGYPKGPMGEMTRRPWLQARERRGSLAVVQAEDPAGESYWLYAAGPQELLFTENETNLQRLFGQPNRTPYAKDAFHHYLIQGQSQAVNRDGRGTKVAALYQDRLAPGGEWTLRLRLANRQPGDPFADHETLFATRRREADEFYAELQNPDLDPEERMIQRQALAGMLWNKQLYYFDIPQWLQGDPGQPRPPGQRRFGRNGNWKHLTNFDVISMPDKWEYPWYATWDLAFHCIPLVLVDPDFAKRQLELVTREWYTHPNGALPAYEWSFDDANPPVHAWAAWRVYKIDEKQSGQGDRAFLQGVFHKLLLNFTWWVNRKDQEGHNLFEGGFLGLDNISLFDRSAELPGGGRLDQADATAWMGFYSLMMMKIALELAKSEPIYQDLATKFFEHFLRIATAMNAFGEQAISLWDEEDGFFYDVLHRSDGSTVPLKARSLVGLMPLIAVETLEPELLTSLPIFERRTRWFLTHRPELADTISCLAEPGMGRRLLVSLLTRERLVRLLQTMLDEDEFLSDYGIRSLSKAHSEPYTVRLDGHTFSVRYEAAESQSGLFGGNSNWRGPVWFPINYLIIEGLQRLHHFYGDDLQVEFPTDSGRYVNLEWIARELSRRLIRIFLRNDRGERPVFGGSRRFQEDPDWQDTILFYEYFHGENGAGLGAGHQTGWTGLVAKLLQQTGGAE